MKNKKNKNTTEVIEGYNPKIYRNLSLIFVALTILNLAIVIFAFYIVGYGLYHAESALSNVASINSCVGEINKNVWEISQHSDDLGAIALYVDDIHENYNTILKNADEFRAIDLSNIDKSLSKDFEVSIKKVTAYYNTISNDMDAVKGGKKSAEVLVGAEKSLAQTDAVDSITALLKKQDESTYVFFCKLAQRFLIVIGFLLLTMCGGLFAISVAKRLDKKKAVELQESRSRAENMRRKAMDLAYVNVISGLQNRFALEEELSSRIKDEKLITAMYNFNNFKKLNESYGRDFADEFIAQTFKAVSYKVKGIAKVFHTDADEICVVFNKDVLRRQASEITNEILQMLSTMTYINKVPVQMTVSACVYYKSKETMAVPKLIMVLDKAITNAKTLCNAKNKSIILPIN